MDREKSYRKVSAIMPAYNEATRMGSVLDVLTKYPRFSEVIVVDDGSSDNTQAIVKNFNVRYIKNKKNLGKGFAMDAGVNAAKEEIIFFCDADVRGLTTEIIDQIIDPVIEGKVDMFIGTRNREVYLANILGDLVRNGPLLGGERALTKNLWNKLPRFFKFRFRIETGLNFYAKHFGKGLDNKIFIELTQVTKEDKFGPFRGTIKRIFMIADILIAHVRILLIKNGR